MPNLLKIVPKLTERELEFLSHDLPDPTAWDSSLMLPLEKILFFDLDLATKRVEHWIIKGTVSYAKERSQLLKKLKKHMKELNCR